jgi:thioesterase domain-containing protein
MKEELETYLYQHIPITQAMGIQVKQISKEKVILSAPFANNINHKRTVFGGSLHAVATLACWSLLYVNLKELKTLPFQIVITKSEVDYQAPVDSDFEAECRFPEEKEWQRFIKMLYLKGKARISLSAQIDHQGRVAVDYQGVFAAIFVDSST